MSVTVINYKKTDSLFARIKEDLSSYDSMGLIDEGKFYQYVKYIVDQFGIAIYEQGEAILKIENNQARLPCDFSVLNAAWKCNSTVDTETNTNHFQGGHIYYLDTTCEDKTTDCSCDISAVKEGETFRKITVREYIKGTTNFFTYDAPVLLQLVGHITREHCAKNCANLRHTSPYHITLDGKFIYTNFSKHTEQASSKHYIYMTYWAFPMDRETGLPLIPDVPVLESAIEWYIKKRIFENLYLNSDDPDVVGKLQLVNAEFATAYGDANSWIKLPAFAELANHMRKIRKRFNIYQIC